MYHIHDYSVLSNYTSSNYAVCRPSLRLGLQPFFAADIGISLFVIPNVIVLSLSVTKNVLFRDLFPLPHIAPTAPQTAGWTVHEHIFEYHIHDYSLS